MTITLNIKDELIEKAAESTGIMDVTALVEFGLEALIATEGAKRPAKLGGGPNRNCR